MANPFLVLGGIAISVATAAFGILQVPGWVASAQDASAVNDLANVRAVQAAAVSQTGEYVTNLGALDPSLGVQLTASDTLRMRVSEDSWCATAHSESGLFLAASDSTTEYGKGVSRQEAGLGAGCDLVPCEDSQWDATYFGGIELAGPVLAAPCLDELNWAHTAATPIIPGVPGTDYSARYAKTVNEGAGTYNFTVQQDDGVRMFIDGVQVWSAWGGSDGTVTRRFSVDLGGGPHEFVVEYFQGSRSAKLIFDWTITR